MKEKVNISFEDTKFIRDHEGFSLSAYPDPVSGGSPFTIAWGLTGSWVTPGLVITQKEAEDRFMSRINSLCAQLDSLIKVVVTKNQYVALLSFSYNLGIGALAGSTLLKKLNLGSFYSAADEFLRWDRAKGKVIKGLSLRRAAEQALFLTP